MVLDFYAMAIAIDYAIGYTIVYTIGFQKCHDMSYFIGYPSLFAMGDARLGFRLVRSWLSHELECGS